ncbi:MAG: hypothetical protein ACYCTH_04110, partial [Cellulomonas sp.]
MRSLEEKVQLWMRAYPRRWRAARGAELLGVVVDLAGPGARRLGVRAVVDLVRGGWATRWRERPPLHVWLGYRFLGLRIPSAYRAWALDDIDGRGYLLRDQPVTLAILVSGWVTAPAPWWWGLLAAAPRAIVDLHANLVLHRGGGEMTPEVVIGPAGPVRPAVMAVLVGALALGAVLALGLGRGARRRLDRLGPQLPPQPNRLVCSLSLPARGELAVWGAGVVAIGWLEVSGQYVLFLSVGVGVVAFALLPLAVRLRAMVDRSTASDLTARDLWQLAVHDRVPPVDAPGVGVRPLTGPVA